MSSPVVLQIGEVAKRAGVSLKAWGLSREEIEVALSGRQSAQSRADRVNHTLEVLLTEQRHAEEQLAALRRPRKDAEDALVDAGLCATCAAEECPTGCERLADLP